VCRGSIVTARLTLDRTLSYREYLTKTAGKLKNRNNLLMKLFHMGRQHQYSAVICPGALLLGSRVLCPSLVTLCSHKSGRCTVELYHASHLWYPAFYTAPMASSAVQHRTASPTKEGCRWQAGREYCQTRQSSNPAWYPQPTIAIRLTSKKPLVDGGVTGSRLRWSSVRPTIRQPGFDVLDNVVSTEPFSAEQKHCVACRRKWRLTDIELCQLRRDPDGVTHCR